MTYSAAPQIDDNNRVLNLDAATPTVMSSLSWSSVIAGAVTIIASAGILSITGIVLGLSGLTLVEKNGMSAGKLGIAVVTWMLVVQWLSSAFGGYMTGRLRHIWQGVHPHESYFRDTAHGFLAWAAAMIFTAVMSFSVASNVIANPFFQPAEKSTSKIAGVLAPSDYEIDKLIRNSHNDAAPADNNLGAEIGRIYAADANKDQLPDDDKSYLVQSIVTHSGVDEAEASGRVSALWSLQKDRYAQAQADLAAADKMTAKIAFYSLLSLLVGAFIASVAAAFGGAHRDEGWGCKKIG